MERIDFHRVRRQVFKFYGQGCYREALEVARAAKGRFPGKEGEIMWWIACLTCRLGNGEGALKILQEALRAGHWWGEYFLLNDPDLEPLRGRPEFKEILEVSKERQRAAQARARPRLLFLPPKARQGKSPLLIALHWAGETAEAFAPYWERARDLGFSVAIPQSSQVMREDGFGWNDGDLARRELAAHWEKLTREEQVDPKQVFIAGASQGGWLAIEIALARAPIPARGFIAVIPAIRDIQKLAEQAKEAAKRGVRGVIITGEHDHFRSAVEDFFSQARNLGLRCELQVVRGLGHDFPDDFPARLGEALRFLLSEEGRDEDRGVP